MLHVLLLRNPIDCEDNTDTEQSKVAGKNVGNVQRLKNRRREKLSVLNGGPVDEKKNEETKAPDNLGWTPELDAGWGEIFFVLKKPILKEQDLLYTVAAAEAGLIYIDAMNTIACISPQRSHWGRL